MDNYVSDVAHENRTWTERTKPINSWLSHHFMTSLTWSLFFVIFIKILFFFSMRSMMVTVRDYRKNVERRVHGVQTHLAYTKSRTKNVLQKPPRLRTYNIQLTRGVHNNRRTRLWIHFADCCGTKLSYTSDESHFPHSWIWRRNKCDACRYWQRASSVTH
jgi:hypothetical protein